MVGPWVGTMCPYPFLLKEYMKEIHLEQNTQEWLDYRRTRIGASDAPIIMGLSPWSTPYDLYKEKVEGIQKKQTWAMNRGKELEPAARELFEKTMLVEVKPKVVQSEVYPWMIASLDGISDDGKTLGEFKCPSSVSSHLKAMQGEIPIYYQCQMQHQMCAVGPHIRRAIYWSYFGGEGEAIELERDDEFIKKMVEEEKKFMMCLTLKTPMKEWLEEKQEFVLETSEELISLTDKYREIDIAIKLLTEDKEITRERMIELAADRNVKCNGISISKKKTEGRLDFKSMPGAFKDEIEKFRLPASQSWCVRVG